MVFINADTNRDEMVAQKGRINGFRNTKIEGIPLPPKGGRHKRA